MEDQDVFLEEHTIYFQLLFLERRMLSKHPLSNLEEELKVQVIPIQKGLYLESIILLIQV